MILKETMEEIKTKCNLFNYLYNKSKEKKERKKQEKQKALLRGALDSFK